MEDARDGYVEDSIGSAKSPKPPRPQDPERTKRLLMTVIAVAAVVAAGASGVTAWEVHQQRVTEKALYCATYAPVEDAEDSDDTAFFSPGADDILDLLDC